MRISILQPRFDSPRLVDVTPEDRLNFKFIRGKRFGKAAPFILEAPADATLPSYLKDGGYDLASESLRSVLARMISDIEFIPVSVVHGERLRRFYVVNVLTEEDCIDFRKSVFDELSGHVVHFSKLVLKGDFAPKAQVFRMSRSFVGWICLTEEAAKQIVEAEISGVELVPVEAFS